MFTMMGVLCPYMAEAALRGWASQSGPQDSWLQNNALPGGSCDYDTHVTTALCLLQYHNFLL